jgi:ketopantoate reductase
LKSLKREVRPSKRTCEAEEKTAIIGAGALGAIYGSLLHQSAHGISTPVNRRLFEEVKRIEEA